MRNWLRLSPIKARLWGAWLIPSLLGTVLLSCPVNAAQLEGWRFDQSQNRLTFTTNGAVQPRVQLVPNPTRLVVDLPGVRLGRPKVTQSLTGTVRSLRVGQFNNQTARIVVELAPNYVIDPSAVKVTPTSASNWSIDLPQPQLLSGSNQSTPVSSQPVAPVSSTAQQPTSSGAIAPSTAAPEPAPPPVAASVEGPYLKDISVTPDGLFLSTSEEPTQVSVRRSRSRKRVIVTLAGVTPNPKLLEKPFQPPYFGLKKLTVEQADEDSEPETTIELAVDKSAPDWRASASRSGVVMIPLSGGSRITRPGATVSLLQNKKSSVAAQSADAPTIKTVSLGGDRLLVEADKPISYATAWEGSSYRLTFRSAKSAPTLEAPKVATGSPLSKIQFREDPTGFSILSTPANGVRISGIQRLSDQQVILQLRRANSVQLGTLPPVISGTPPSVSSGSASQPLGGSLPRPSGGRVVVIDPGHGGRDPGAIGINGLRETNVVLPIALDVSRILQRQGVTVYLTRTDEREIDLAPRVSLAERVRANVFVSIHANAISMSRPDVNGLETYYAPGSWSGKRLAQRIHSSVLGGVNIGSRGVRSARFYVIRRTSMPAALVETGFLTGAVDNPKLANPAFRRQMAEAIARGILQYLAGT